MEVFQDFSDLLYMRRASNEAFKNYEVSFSAPKTICARWLHIPQWIVARNDVLSRSCVDDSQLIPILSSTGGLYAI